MQNHIEWSQAILGCKVWLGKERLEEVKEFKYLGVVRRQCQSGEVLVPRRLSRGILRLSGLRRSASVLVGRGSNPGRYQINLRCVGHYGRLSKFRLLH